MRQNILFTIFVTGILFLFGSFPAFASVYSFYSITNNTEANVAIGKAQLSVDVTNTGVNQVLFTFRNTGVDDCSIAEVYFDDGSLLGIAELIDVDNGGDPGVDFEQEANPPDLPGGNNAFPPFNVTAGFLSQADNPAPKKGVNPGEYLGILFNLQTGRTFADVLDDLSTDALRIGLHVTAFTDGGSESFISTVPVPATVWMFGASLVGLFGIRRKLSSHNPS